MDDEITQYKTQIKGQAYSFRPFTDDEMALVVELRYMHASGDRYAMVIMGQLKDASEPDQWDSLTDRLVAREISLEDVLAAFKKLFERQLKAKENSAPADAQ